MTHSAKPRAAKFVIVALAALSTSACVVGPDYQRPDVAQPGEFRAQIGPAEAKSFDSFNVALCRSALMLFPNRAKALDGVYRALKPAGRFAVTVW